MDSRDAVQRLYRLYPLLGMRLITAILARNESDRYLRRVLERASDFSDAILVLDDGSTDDTVSLAKSFLKAVVKQRKSEGFWGKDETPARAELWERAVKLAQGGWILFCDADQLLMGDPRPYCYSWEVGIWSFPLADCWDSEDQMRVDGPWAYGASTPRPWMVNTATLKDFKPEWARHGLHVGHLPSNLLLPDMHAPTLWWRHLSYVQRDDRLQKHRRYTEAGHLLSEQEMAHAASVAD